ncbi:MAG: hypothetical protein Q7V12_06690 [Deltaproteobacteria bacterium]|jgi:hypothetical protein|nr:hypothetical protein [Deltaproteobacteria bacterium]MDP2971681.1 hypothetical protein [Deltaproteobacteria bacterium]
MKRRIVTLLIILTFVGAYNFVRQEKAYGDVDVHIGIGVPIPPPPPVVIPAPPSVILIPGTPVYYAPDCGVEIFFYAGNWWRKHNGYWFRATYYNGPWVYVAPPQIPAVLVKLPPDYHKIPPGQRRIPFGQLKKHGKK